MKRNRKSIVTGVTASALPILIATSEGEQDGFGIDGSKMIPVKVITQKQMLALVRETPTGRPPRFVKPEEWQAIQAAHSLRNGLENDKLELQHAFELLDVPYPADSRHGASHELWQVLALQKLTDLMSEGRLVFWFDDRNPRGQLSPGIFCPDRTTAVIVPLLFDDLFHICPRCRKVFFSQKRYCSTRCQGAHRVARWRARKGGH